MQITGDSILRHQVIFSHVTNVKSLKHLYT